MPRDLSFHDDMLAIWRRRLDVGLMFGAGIDL